MNKLFNFFDRGLTWADWLWRLVTFLIVIFGGTTAALLAKASELFRNSSPLIWFFIGIITAFVLTLTFYLFNLSRKQAASAKYLNSLSTPSSNINPLLAIFEDKVIKLSDLELPLNAAHEQKVFKRCKIIGPGTLAILGSTLNEGGFIECGDVIAVPPGIHLPGVMVLKNCTLNQCHLINMTIVTINNQSEINNFTILGMRVITGEFHDSKRSN